jgi:hypothetical protein
MMGLCLCGFDGELCDGDYVMWIIYMIPFAMGVVERYQAPFLCLSHVYPSLSRSSPVQLGRLPHIETRTVQHAYSYTTSPPSRILISSSPIQCSAMQCNAVQSSPAQLGPVHLSPSQSLHDTLPSCLISSPSGLCLGVSMSFPVSLMYVP